MLRLRVSFLVAMPNRAKHPLCYGKCKIRLRHCCTNTASTIATKKENIKGLALFFIYFLFLAWLLFLE